MTESKQSKYVIEGYPLSNLVNIEKDSFRLDVSDPTDFYNDSKKTIIYFDHNMNKVKERKKTEDDIKYDSDNYRNNYNRHLKGLPDLEFESDQPDGPFTNIDDFPELGEMDFPYDFENCHLYNWNGSG